MKFRKLLLFTVTSLTVTHATLFAASTARGWKPLPARLWAQVVSVPPGTASVGRPEVTPGTDTPAAQTPTAPVNPAPPAPAPAGGTPDPAQSPSAFPPTPPPGVPAVGVAPTAATPTSTATPRVAAPTGSTPVTPVRLPQQEQPVSIPKLPENCTVTLEKTEASVDATGGPVVFAPKFSPASCATEPVSTGGWLKRVKSSNAAVYSFVAEPNGTSFPRQAAIRIGTIAMSVVQAPGKRTSIAAAPSRVELKVGGKGGSRQVLTVWSDEPSTAFAATTAELWLKVTPASNAGKAGAKKFNIELAPADLKPGVHQGFVDITSPGTTSGPIRIPVVVTIAEKQP